MARVCLVCVVLAILLVSVWTPLADAVIAQRWFSWPNIALLAPVPILTAIIACAAWRALQGRYGDKAPFLAAMGLFLMSVLSRYRHQLLADDRPAPFSLWQAASSPSTQAFLLIGTLFLLAVILMYAAWSYWVFRGKIRDEIGYR
jgi:cytochrome bd ubiquinol oxidase subunit II